MKLNKAALFLAGAAGSLDTAAAIVLRHNANASAAGGRVVASPQDIASCTKYFDGIFDRPVNKDEAIEMAVDHCAVEHKEDDRNYVCVDFKEGLLAAFSEEHNSQEFSSKTFCEISEAYMIDSRGASRMENVGSGPLFNFKISSKCEPMVTAHFDPKGASFIESAEVPDLWYGICMNQDCGHYLPSRTRWCQFQMTPSHSVQVCEALLKFTTDVTKSQGAASMDAKAVCALYGDFVAATGHDVEAYEAIVHSDTVRRVPKPHDQARALQSSKLLNDAGGHHIRDNAGDPIKRNGAARAASAPLLAAVAAVLAAITALAA